MKGQERGGEARIREDMREEKRGEAKRAEEK